MRRHVHSSERAALVERYRQLHAEGLCSGTSGNLSVRLGEHVLITPSGLDPEVVEPHDVCEVAVDGTPVRVPGGLSPSSELPMHLATYAAAEVDAVVHTHSPYATALSTTVVELPAIHYNIVSLGGPVRVAPYATFGSQELAGNLRAALEGRSAALLQNHGAVTCGADLGQAYHRAVLLEWLCALYWRARQIGEPRILTAAELEAARTQLETLRYGEAAPTDER